MEIFVNNLSYEIEEAELRDTFAQHGEVRRVTVVRDRETGRPRGFGFVDMADPEAAQRAIAALNGTTLQGRPLMVSEARPRPSFSGPRDARPPSSGTASYAAGASSRPWSPPARTQASPSAIPMISDRRPTGGDAAERDDSPEAELEEQRRRTLARIANFATRDKKKVGERFEEGKRRITKGPEKGRRSKVSGDDDDEADDLPVRIR